MDGLRQLLARIGEQLSVMTRSQQVAIGLCAVIIMGSMLWLTQWSTRPQLEPLLDQAMTPQEMSTALQHLEGIRAEFEERGDRIYVKPDQRRKLQRELAGAGALPQDTTLGFENLLQDQSPFQPESINRRNYLIALQNELAAVMTADPKVASAKVFINEFKSRRAGPLQSLEPTASVTLRTQAGKQIDGPAVQAMADLVSGAVAGLAPHNVNVSVNGRPRPIPGPEDLVSYGLLEEKKKNEKHFAEKIYDLLSYIPGVKVAVAVELDVTRRHVEKRKYAEPALKMERESSDESSAGTPAGEAGVNPNTGTALSNAGSGQSTSGTESLTEFFAQNPVEIATEEHPPFQVAGVTASINIPRSYFVSVFKAERPDGNEPNNDDLQALIDIEQKRVRAAVRNLIHATENDAVTVDWFPDLVPGGPGSPGGFPDSPFYALGGEAADDGNLAGYLSYAPQAGLGGLAVVSLLMMVMLVRKSARSAVGQLPKPPPREDEDQEAVAPLQEVGLTEGFLEGQEVDEGTLRVRNLSDQVSRMVEEDPETAADLLRRWVEGD